MSQAKYVTIGFKEISILERLATKVEKPKSPFFIIWRSGNKARSTSEYDFYAVENMLR